MLPLRKVDPDADSNSPDDDQKDLTAYRLTTRRDEARVRLQEVLASLKVGIASFNYGSSRVGDG